MVLFVLLQTVIFSSLYICGFDVSKCTGFSENKAPLKNAWFYFENNLKFDQKKPAFSDGACFLEKTTKLALAVATKFGLCMLMLAIQGSAFNGQQ